jgi:hypothetical protein
MGGAGKQIYREDHSIPGGSGIGRITRYRLADKPPSASSFPQNQGDLGPEPGVRTPSRLELPNVIAKPESFATRSRVNQPQSLDETASAPYASQ